MIPPKWRDSVLNCRKCKFIFYPNILFRKSHNSGQTAVGLQGDLTDEAIVVMNESQELRIWLHVVNSTGKSYPDTNVYHNPPNFQTNDQATSQAAKSEEKLRFNSSLGTAT